MVPARPFVGGRAGGVFARPSLEAPQPPGQSRVVVVHRFGGLVFTWDEAKAVENVRKHSVTFEEAATVFVDPLSRVYDDPDHSVGEQRFLLVGASLEFRLLVVVHVERRDTLRIISARPATPKERKGYENA